MGSKKGYNKMLFWLIATSTLIRAFLAYWLELGNDEVYYWTYALFPDWSHYDHPPMVGWVIQLFSLNLLFDSEIFIRLSSVIFFGINTWIIFLIGKFLRNAFTGLMAALLYNASVYAFVLTGIFILPDTPQSLFWFISLYFVLKVFSRKESPAREWKHMLILGFTIGLTMLSKYTGIFLWVGIGLYILFYDRLWLKKPVLYISVLISMICVLPILIWNIQNDFVSFTFHSDRVNILDGGIRLDYFFRELFGQVFYNNPINYILILIAIVALFKGRTQMPASSQRLLLLIAIPLIGLFLIFSIFRPTLPHWTGPAYNTLLLIVACHISIMKQSPGALIKIPKVIKASLALLAVILTIGTMQIKYGFIPVRDNNPFHRLGRHDVTLDLYGWRSLLPEFEKVREQQLALGEMNSEDAIVADNWFPLANLDYYIARPLSMRVLGLGKPNRLNKYTWINDERNGFKLGENYWYLTTSRDYRHPEAIYQDLFNEITVADTITLMRGGKPAKRVFVFLLKDLQQQPANYYHTHD